MLILLVYQLIKVNLFLKIRKFILVRVKCGKEIIFKYNYVYCFVLIGGIFIFKRFWFFFVMGLGFIY